jgi:hypothetical protein
MIRIATTRRGPAAHRGDHGIGRKREWDEWAVDQGKRAILSLRERGVRPRSSISRSTDDRKSIPEGIIRELSFL